METTAEGVAFPPVLTWLPFPNWPRLFLPQHITLRFVNTAHVLFPPAATTDADEARGT